jgi:hypothetical protein
MSSLSVLYCYAYVNDTYGNACAVFGAFEMQKVQRMHMETVYAGTDYTFPVLLFNTFAISQQHALL